MEKVPPLPAPLAVSVRQSYQITWGANTGGGALFHNHLAARICAYTRAVVDSSPDRFRWILAWEFGSLYSWLDQVFRTSCGRKLRLGSKIKELNCSASVHRSTYDKIVNGTQNQHRLRPHLRPKYVNSLGC